MPAPLRAKPVVAIVGTRVPDRGGEDYARALATIIVGKGGIVASGGARGIDTAAHEAALDAGGATWAVAPSGSDHDVPRASSDLYKRIRATEGSAIIWPFPKRHRGRYAPYLARNGVLAALADAVVVVQAPLKSGARNTAKWARMLARPLWVVVPGPEDESKANGYEGCFQELGLGAKLLRRTADLLISARLDSSGVEPLAPPLARSLSSAEIRVLKGLSVTPKHTDEVALHVGLDAPTVTTALLTLALENVVVEGPGGFFRRT